MIGEFRTFESGQQNEGSALYMTSQYLHEREQSQKIKGGSEENLQVEIDTTHQTLPELGGSNVKTETT